MEYVMAGPQTFSPVADAGMPSHRPISLTKWLLLLVLGSIVLVAYIGLQRDLRLKRYTLEQATWYADKLSEKLGDSHSLPLNLDVVVPAESEAQMFTMEWLSREDARILRQSQQSIIVGRANRLLRRVLTPDGLMVVTFHNGQFKGEWLSQSEYESAMQSQHNELNRLKNVSPPADAP